MSVALKEEPSGLDSITKQTGDTKINVIKMPATRKKEDDNKIREFLIQQVKEHRAIWDTTSQDHLKTGTVIANDWAEIQKCLLAAFGQDCLEQHNSLEVEDIKRMWQNLRATFRWDMSDC